MNISFIDQSLFVDGEPPLGHGVHGGWLLLCDSPSGQPGLPMNIVIKKIN